MRKAKGFTLIELLMVIAIIALLMAILLPTLQRVRRQAKAVGCQSNLRQWGFAFSMHAGDNDGKLFGLGVGGNEVARAIKVFSLYGHNINDVLLCPMVMRLHDRPDEPEEWMFQELYK